MNEIGLKLDRYYINLYKKFNMKFHKHFSYEIMYVESGKCEVKIEYQNKITSYILKKNMFIFLYKNIPHRLIVKTPCKILNLEFSLINKSDSIINYNNLIKKNQPLKNLLTEKKPNVFHDDSSLDILITKIINKKISKDITNSHYLINVMICELLIYISYMLKYNLTSGISYIKKALLYINENIENDIKIADIADYAGISPIYIQKLFKESFHITITEHIRKIRINRAKVLIRNTNMPLIDIAVQCGFNSRQNFYNSFKIYENMSPSDYKLEAKKNNKNYNQAPYEIFDSELDKIID